MQRLLLLGFTLLYCLQTFAATPPLNATNLGRVDRSALEASLQGDVVALEGLLADGFEAVIQVPSDNGPQTLRLTRTEFLLYAWQASSLAEQYRVRPQPARYDIAKDGRSAVGVQVLSESLRWQGQPLRYTSRRTTRYQPRGGRILITRLDVQILGWKQGH